MNFRRMGPMREGVGWGRDRYFLILVGVILLVRTLYVLSYPFLIEGDGETYYRLLLESQAHLLHATGYIFFFLPVSLLAKLVGTEPANALLYAQQALSVASVAALYLALKRLVPRWISFLTCLPLGIDTQMVAAAGTTRPEFLQADILMLLVSSAIFGLTSLRPRDKTIFYLGAGVLGMAGYLTKYNFLPVLSLCLAPLFDSGLQWKSRWRMLGQSFLGATLLLVLFLTSFHYPTTGSFRLNLEHGWIYILKLKEANIPLLPANGIATQKYIILSEHLPRHGAGPGPWKKIDEVPEAVRSPFKQQWSTLLASNDPRYVRTAFDALDNLEQRRSSYYEPADFFSIYYYLGLEQGEKLLRAVFWEGVGNYPRQYLSHVWAALIRNTDFSAQYEPYLPVPHVYRSAEFFESTRRQFLPARARVFQAVDWSVAQPENLADLAAQIWYPGARFFSFLAFLKYIPASCLWIVMISGLVVTAVGASRNRRLSPAAVLLILTAIALLGELGFSAVLFVFRMKELILCQPLIYLMMGLSVSFCMELVSRPGPTGTGKKTNSSAESL